MKIYKIKSDSNHLFKLKIYIKNLVFVKVRLFFWEEKSGRLGQFEGFMNVSKATILVENYGC